MCVISGDGCCSEAAAAAAAAASLATLRGKTNLTSHCSESTTVTVSRVCLNLMVGHVCHCVSAGVEGGGTLSLTAFTGNFLQRGG